MIEGVLPGQPRQYKAHNESVWNEPASPSSGSCRMAMIAACREWAWSGSRQS